MPSIIVPAVHPLDTLESMTCASSTIVSSHNPSSPSASSSTSASLFTSFTASDTPSSPRSPSTQASFSPPSPTSASIDSSVSSGSVLSRLARRCMSGSCWSGPPPLVHRRCNLKVYASTPFLIALFSLQIVLHAAYFAASILLLVRSTLLTDLLQGHDEPFAFGCLQYLPAFLVARSVISIPLIVRRLWLMHRWQSTWVDSAVCVLLLTATCVLSALGLIAVAQLPSSSTWMYPASWLLVGSLLLLAGWQLAMYAALLLFFRMETLTVSSPMLPLAQQYYEQPQQNDKPKPFEGLTQEQLQAMPVSVYEGGREDAVCAVCMDDVELGQVQRVLRCGHAYHQPCIDPWLLKKRVCPLCVQSVRPTPSRPTVSEWVVEMAERAKPCRRDGAQVTPLIV